MADLRALAKSERRVLNTLEGLENFARRYDPSQDEPQIAVRLESLEAICKEFYAIRQRIELLTDETAEDEDDKDVQVREKANLAALTEFEERYFRVKASLTSKRAPPPPTATTSGIGQPGDRSDSSFSKVKLPEIRLPSFGGRIMEWVPFRDSFCSLIHENKQLTDMDRFSYLKSALSGEALLEMESVELSAVNYCVAWKALESRYENKKLIVKAHLDALFAVEGMKRESYDGLSNLIGGFEKNLQMLQKIGENTAAWSTILAYMVYSRLDPATLRQWETHHNSKNVPTYQNMIAFLRSHCAVLQSVAPVNSKPSGSDYRSSKTSVCHTTVKLSRKCLFCGDSWHPAFVCGKFQRLQVAERLEVVSKAKLCRNCLSLGHWARYCDKGTCRHCQQKHHTLLHGAPIRSSVPQSQSNPPTQTRQQPQSPQPRPNPRPQTSNASYTTPSDSQRPSTQSPATNTATSTTQTHIALPVTPTHNILLSTALVRVQDRHGNTMLARALLDSCSQHCLMTKEFSSRMNFYASPSLLSVQGIGSSISTSTKIVSAVVRPRLEGMSAFSQEMHFNVLPQLTVSLPTASCSISGWNLPEAVHLADPRFHEPGPVDIIIGAEYYMDLLRNERHKATEDGPTLQNTEFGWIVSGKIPDHPVGSPSLTFVCSTNDLQEHLTKFWDRETCRSHSTQSLEESACEAYFNRTISETGEVCVRLLTAKSRVAPLDNLKRGNRRLSTPRFKLSSALLLVHLFEKVVSSLSKRARWKQFIAWVSEIQHITKDGVWNHVAGLQNPADIISRGMAPVQLQYESLWFSGPYWLRSDECNWPSAPPISENEFDPVDLEVKTVSAALPVIQPSDIFSLRSSFSDLQRLTAWILRFRYNSQSANQTTKVLVRLCQQESFPQELVDLTSGRVVRESSKILALNPQLEDGILCVGGRLRHASITNRRKHPYILDHRHPFAYIVVAHYHLKLLHGGQQLIISTVRERFWPTSVRNLVRKVLHECVPCFRVRPKIQDQLMADLPPERVTPCPPFQRVGVDYCGPFQVTYPHRRSRPVKIFVAVYICLVTMAVHLELAADLSAQGFIATLKRFSSRRGKPELIMCDNGRNFVGARRQLDELRRLFINQQFQSNVVRQANEEQIEFRFIPARSPNFGGLWESAVKSFKLLFKRTIGTRTLLYDEMATILTQAEAVLNSRPLTPLSNDPDDFEALTPGHFLIQRPLTAIPEPDLDGIPENRLSAFQKAQRYTQQLWKNWSKLYLSDLHNRTKWTVRRNNIAVGTMVVLKDEERPPLKWQLGRVTDVHAGEDMNVRVVTVKTKDGSYRRAVSRICVLPIRDNIVSSNGEN
ncbi:uncharacterized protein LOC134291696 [Aedes albopictus]|uniref:Integrase catalytic domain-containing protein n=1 Tax=Aedes albopictus TaxID=7160 RepID=A0ABM1ZPY9_AEDAL